MYAPSWAPAAVQLELFPVPTSDLLQIRLTGVTETTVDVRMLDLVGRAMITRTGVSAAAGSLDVSQLPAGVYLLEVRGDDNRMLGLKRVVVQ